MDEEERLQSCQREIFRLRNVVRCLEEDQRTFEARLQEEIQKGNKNQSGLRRALEIWQEI